MIRTLIAVGVAGVALTALAACASSTTGTSGLSSASTPASTAPSTPSPPSPTPTTAPPSSAPAAAAACKTGDVSVTVSSGQGAAGTQVQRFIVTNTSSSPCTMSKYPFVSPYGLQTQGSSKAEATLDDIKVGHIASDFGDLGGDGGVRTLAPNGTTVFFLKWSDVPVGNNPCDNADGFDFRPPQDQSSDDNKLVSYKFTTCGGALEVSQMLSPSIGS